MWAEFKEKTFETAFVGELRLITNVLYAPDQCDEYYLGFDAAAFIPWEYLPLIAPYARARRWRNMVGITAAHIEQFGRELNQVLPSFKFNMFFQFKRPEFMVGHNAAEWHIWKQPYFRYKLEPRQQKLLDKIGKVGKGRSVAVYAVAAFHKCDDLFKHQIDDAVIDNTNVLNTDLLTGHAKCTFAGAGSFGMGHSEPEEVRSRPIRETIDEMMSNEGISFTRHIKDTGDLIRQLLEDDEEGRESLLFARRAILGGDISEFAPRAEGSWLDSAITMTAFSFAFGVSVCAIG